MDIGRARLLADQQIIVNVRETRCASRRRMRGVDGHAAVDDQ
jgi:hypothetical protein